MLFQTEDSRSLFRFLKRVVSKDAKGTVEPSDSGGACIEDTERAYEIADALEGGLARELTTDFQHPLRRANSLWKFRVVRSEDRLHYHLFSGTGDFLMYASASAEGRQILMYTYDPDESGDSELFDRSRPAFTLKFDETKSNWELFEERCEYCRCSLRCHQCKEKKRLARMKQSKIQVGDGIFNAMDVQLPGLRSDGTPVVECAAYEDESPCPQRLTTKPPKWNDQVDSLVLDFKGRKVLSSAKNFQLVMPHRPEHVVLQYGKIGPHTFGLDFKHPLSVAQAFGVSLATLLWT